jgi:hypothetical protein
MNEEFTVNVVVAETHLERIDEVVSGLRAAGLRDISVLEAVGLIQGVAGEDTLAGLGAVAGVSAVERSREVHVPPLGHGPQ